MTPVNYPIKITGLHFLFHWKFILKKKFKKCPAVRPLLYRVHFSGIESFPLRVIEMISVGMIDSTISNLNPYHCIIIDTLVEKNRDAITDSMEKKSEISCERQTLAFVMMTDDYSFFFKKNIYGILCFNNLASGVTMGTVHLGLCHITYPYTAQLITGGLRTHVKKKVLVTLSNTGWRTKRLLILFSG